ncbi:MAG: hypothetical protein GY708_05820 [Actinomycetia bacterium]|nr:hypothetical protein [Actinomycetes bacterium]MCP4960439.1 hypothetical protein [Actinomycetes bacterium]
MGLSRWRDARGNGELSMALSLWGSETLPWQVPHVLVFVDEALASRSATGIIADCPSTLAWRRSGA